MDPQKIAQMLASGDKEQVKAAQKQLQALGYNVGAKGADGGLGKDTSAAIAQYKKDFEAQQSAERQSAEKESAAKLADAEARAAEARAREAEQDPTNRLTKLGTELGPYVAGGAVGYGLSRGLKQGFDEKDKEIGKSVKRISGNRSIRPDIADAELGRIERNRLLRTGRQFLIPGGFFAASQATRDLVAPQFQDPATRDAINLIATGEQGAGITLAAKQLYDMSKRDTPIDPEDRGVIKTRAAEFRSPTPAGAPAPTQALSPVDASADPVRHSQRFRDAVTATGAKPGKTKSANYAALKKGITPENLPAVAEALNLPKTVDKSTVLQRAREMMKTAGKAGILFPVAAGAMAYNMVDSPASASTGEDGGPSTGNRLAAGGAAAGTVYGANKLLGLIPEAVKMAGGVGLRMLNPAMAVDMTDGLAGPQVADEAELIKRNSDVQSMPFLRHLSPNFAESYDMAQVPERGVASSGPRVSRLPAPASPLVTGEADDFDFDAQLAELSDIFAQLEAGDQPQPQAPAPMPVAPYAPQNRLLTGR